MTTIEARRNGAVIPGDSDRETSTVGSPIEPRQPTGSGELHTESRSPMPASRRGEEAHDDAERTLRLVIRSRTASVWLTVFIATHQLRVVVQFAAKSRRDDGVAGLAVVVVAAAC